ncbi:hypothetical protein POJ06DRAFT_255884 [Lipomyces tetrasporus]|uniref:NADPH-dependent FMN and FAD-containing oxidoreductase n=1 Tax=Lipomyces tetrasporus TaxID=54092 RepID=A0AAD7QPF6_9ASCO|nr:uncharacterized protein POJ06DRAFT_255884 [Lipomyces tetrasporus]KAJ8099073.1 hypothetical protein POJ06DRAFT_255884 [Lipomyces tetrasporus]
MTGHHGPPVAIVYFSETGTAHSLADRLRKQLLRLHFRAFVLDAEDVGRVTAVLLGGGHDEQRPIVVFICATTGNGEIPRHARKLWKILLRRRLTPESCAGLLFTSFGLGDTAYARFNWAAKKLHKRILQLGGRELCTRGEGDESASGGIEGGYATWEPTLLYSLLDLYPLTNGLVRISDDTLLPPEFEVSILQPSESDVSQSRLLQSRVTPTTRLGNVVANHRITPPTHFQDTRQFKFAADEKHWESQDLVPGATALVYSQNDPAAVSALILSQHWDDIADNLVAVPAAVEKWATTKPLTLRSLLTYHLDLNAVPRATFFETLSYFSEGNEHQREKLKEFADATNDDYIQDRYDYADRPRRSALECLLEFDSVKLPVAYILEVFGLLRPRQFSIAGWSNGEIELLIAVVKYRTVLRRIRHGVCTKYISDLKPGEKFLYEIARPQAKPPPIDKPVVLVGPGTGVAPLRALLIERFKGNSNAPSMLVFGNRSRVADFYYESEWKTMTTAREEVDDNGVLTLSGPTCAIVACFSRDGNSTRYVQQVLKRDDIAKEVGRLLAHEGGYVWVCGSKGKMPRAVRSALEDAIEIATGENGGNAVAEMDKLGRYLEETW